ncbi:MAG: glycosyltransferase, partial [Chloroflexi bacterium]|nr:glycosyltransferase [Chloroflexota bacterium]
MVLAWQWQSVGRQGERAELNGFPGVDIVIPVLNEERDLPKCVAALREFLPGRLSVPYRIVVADNGST